MRNYPSDSTSSLSPGETCLMHLSPDSNPTITPYSSGAMSPYGPAVPSVAAKAIIAVVRVYKLVLSPAFAGCCRFEPSCSSYMVEAVARHGALKGAFLGLRRLLRCHPFGHHGYDPVPRA